MKIETDKIKRILQKLPKVLAENFFLTFLFLFLLALSIGGVVFYRFVIMSEAVESTEYKKPLKFKEDIYHQVLDDWNQRQDKFEGADNKSYINVFIFRETSIPPATTTTSTTTDPGIATSTSETGTTTPEFSELMIERLLASQNIFEYYLIKDGRIPLVSERREVWEAKGLGPAWEYEGTENQNKILLAKLKEELTQ